MSRLWITLGLMACAQRHPSPSPGTPAEVVQGFGERGGLIQDRDAYGDSATRLVYLDQGWGPAETLWYYHADQGSVLMPYETLVHLEQAGSEARLIAPEHLATFRFLNQHATPNNPDALPVGFARHDDQVGLTCAACHTAQINYRGTAMRIDGAPTGANVTGFFDDIEAALTATLAEPGKLARYATAVGREVADATARLQATLAWFQDYNRVNRSTTVEGFGRIDAVDRIVNQAIRFTSSSANSITPNAPASLPVLWDAPRHDYVQWTGFAPNAGAGSLGRNAGEVLGVYAHVEVKHYETEQAAKAGYPSTVQAENLVSMEDSLRGLQSPQWPQDILGPIDAALAARGAALYDAHCQACHAHIDRDDPARKVTAQIIGIDKVGTDPTAATNLTSAVVPSGILEGALSPDGARYGATMPALVMLKDLDIRILSTRPVAAVRALASAKLAGLEETPKQGDYTAATEADPMAPLRAYKARPLNGAWASAPYLHNGAVPTLWALLSPEAERPATFRVGRLEYDPQHVGFVADGPLEINTALTGNSNRGHTYGTTLPESDRWALIEYLKSL